MSTLHDTPSTSHPLMFQHGSVIGVQNLSASGGEMAARLARQYSQAGMEFGNARRFHGDILVGGRLKNKVTEKKKSAGQRGKGGKISTASGTPVGSEERGRVRFQVGRSPGDLIEEGDEGGQMGGVEALVRRMWVQGMDGGVGED